MRKQTKYIMDKSEIEELAGKLVNKKLKMVEPADFQTFFFEEVQ